MEEIDEVLASCDGQEAGVEHRLQVLAQQVEIRLAWQMESIKLLWAVVLGLAVLTTFVVVAVVW